jgi:hypothetical protein
MSNWISPTALNPTRPGDPIRSPVWNTFIRTAKNVEDEKNINGIFDFAGHLAGVNNAGETIPKYSIFTIETPGKSFRLAEPSCLFNKYVDGDKLLLTNSSSVIAHQTARRVQVLSNDKIYRFKYAGTDPTAGDLVGPVEGEFTVSLEGTGIVVVTEPDTTNKLLWGWPISGAGGSRIYTCKLDQTLAHGDVGSATLYEQVGVALPIPTATVINQVLNMTGVELAGHPTHSNVPWHWLFYKEDFNLPTVFPEEFQVCFAPEFVRNDMTS